ncbi:MAG TPA: metallophosphoesterase [Acidimicrobiales bacterium]|nr:metallophosphoesterase [Acidimicrobiales bacterium]
MRRAAAALVAAALLLVAAGCGDEQVTDGAATTVAPGGSAPPSTTTPPSTAPPTTTTAPPEPAVLLAAGDVASCASDGDEATGALLDELPGTVAALGDLAYDRGTRQEWADCFGPSWGRHTDRIRPVPGNHDYGTDDGAPYFEHFGAAAGSPGQGWYAYDLGSWRVIALNSVCWAVGGCGPGSPQDAWLRGELARHADRPCTLAYFHHAPFSSGRLHGGEPTVRPLVEALYDGGVDVVLTGHEHHYERFGRLDPSGGLDEVRGIRHFVVGTGGNRLYALDDPHPSSEARFADGYGLLRLELGAGEYAWRFVGVPGVAFTDAGAEPCH